MEPGDDPQEDVFEIPSKEPAPEALLKWRQATLVLNATRRFRYTAKVQGTAPNGMPLSSSSFKRMDHDAAAGGGADGDKVMTPAQRFRKSGHALVALQRFKQAGKERKARFAIKDDFGEDGFGISAEQLLQLNEEASADTLKEIGGALGVCKALRVNPDQGISGDEQDVEKRRQEFGTNTYPRKPPKSFFMFAWEACQDLTLIILMVCALLSLVAGMLTEPPAEGWYEGVSIAAAVIIVIFVTALSDYKQSLQFRGLNEEKSNIKLKVLRGGRVQTVSIFELLVGDIAPLSIGDQVPGDGLFVSGHSLTIDESSMTGESDPMLKSAEKPFLLSGCKVVDGVGTMVITAVGMNTEWGKVMATLNEDEESETPLQVRLNGLATGIGWLGLTVAALVLAVMLIRYFVTYEPKAPMAVVKDIVYILSIAVTIIVVAVPEGLPLAVTLTLAYSMKKMMADKALVRHLAACETMGSATTICSDKTGTLTLNQMTPMQEWIGGDLHPCGSGKAPGGELWKSVSEGVAQNTTARVYIPPDGTPEVTGSPTESAIVNWALQLGLDFNQEQASSSVLAVETFNSTKKRAGVAIRRPDRSVRVHWKGAAEMIVGQCTSWMSHDGELRPLDDAMAKSVLDAITTMAASSLRCIGIAYRVVPESQVPADSESWKFPDTDLTLLAIVGIKDPCRPGVPDAVARCQRAGVKVRMVTGDNVLTARAIASECGILTPDGVVVEGKDFRVLGKEEMMTLIPKIDVMARSSPTDKHLLVKTLRQMGDVVAVTGDGTNDAPALKEADIGLSMGITGTEVAKESSDIVILDDNFTSIVKVVRWGRSVFANIQKFIQFQLTVNVVALTLNFIAACSGGEVPLNAVQLLWVNLIMDTLGALALATEAPTDELLEREPVGRKAPLITNIMWRNIFGQAIYQLAVLLTLNYGGEDILHLQGEEDPGLTNRTIIFNAFVFCQLFNEINARKPEKLNVFEGLHTSPLFIGVWVVSLGFQIIIIELLHKFAETVSLSVTQWLICIAIGAVSLPLAVVVKLIPVPAKPFAETLIPKSWQQRRGRFGQSASLSSSGSVSAPSTRRSESAASARRAVALEEGVAGEENVSMKQRMLDGEGGTNDDGGPPPPIRT